MIPEVSSSPGHCTVSSTWKVKDSGALGDILLCHVESENESAASEQALTAEGIILVPPDSTSERGGAPRSKRRPCQLHITCHKQQMEKMVVTAIDVLSTAKKIEVSASTGEYLMTAKGIRLDVGTKRKLFLTQHTFEEAQDKCSLKLVSLVDPSDVWMHSLHVTMRRIVEPTLPIQLPPSIDMGRVEARMAEMDTRVSGQAKGLMDKMKTAQNNREQALGSVMGAASGGFPSMSGLMGMFATMGLRAQNREARHTTSSAATATGGARQYDSRPPSKSTMDSCHEQEPDITSVSPVPTHNASADTREVNGASSETDKKAIHRNGLTPSQTSLEVSPHTCSEGTCEPSSVVTHADLTAFEQRLELRLRQTEDNVVQRLMVGVTESEHRILGCMDQLVAQVAAAFMGGPKSAGHASATDSTALD